MKRGEGPKRKTELRRTEFVRKTPSPKLSGSSLSRAARKPMRRTPIVAKRTRATADEVQARRTVRQRSGGRCELGWVCDGDEATDYAHRQARSQGGPFDAANAGDACRACHSAAHAAPGEARRRGWSVRRGHDFRAIPVEHARHGLVLLTSDGSVTPTTREAA